MTSGKAPLNSSVTYERRQTAMMLLEALPELVGDVEGALIRLGRSNVADQLRTVALKTWTLDEFAQTTYLHLAAARDPSGVEETLCLYDDIGVNVDLDRDGRVVGLEVSGYEQALSRLGKARD
jgi:uncharacterized protein YuzE